MAIAEFGGSYLEATYERLSKLWSLLGTLNIRCRIIIGIQKGTIILTTTHMWLLMD